MLKGMAVDVRAAGSAKAEPHIVLEKISKRYGGGAGAVTAIHEVNLNIRKSEFLSILGPSGCGKSTLLMMIAGLISPTTGNVTVSGVPVTRPLTDIGIAFQQDLLFDWRTILGNVLIQSDIRGLDKARSLEKARSLLARVGLDKFENHRPWQLSGGMRQRVAICRAILHGASILLMDEPFGALDALTRDQMNLDLQNLWMQERQTAIMVTHSISEAIFLSDRVSVMSARPSKFVFELEVNLPRPRTIEMRDSPEFVRLQHQLRQAIEPPRS